MPSICAFVGSTFLGDLTRLVDPGGWAIGVRMDRFCFDDLYDRLLGTLCLIQGVLPQKAGARGQLRQSYYAYA